jgi:putative transcriptional regulator
VSTTEPDGAPSSAEDLGAKLLRSVREMKAGQAARATRVEPNEVAQARQSIGLSQAEFAAALHISRRTLQEWEQGRRSPSGAAQALIRIASRHPEIVRESLG